MSPLKHTYGPTCHLNRSVAPSGSKDNEDIPDLQSQFFYSSPLPIDDPLSNISTPAGSDSRSVKHPPRPFSARDTKALEEAWLELASEKDRRKHIKGKYPILGVSKSRTGSDGLGGTQKDKHASVQNVELESHTEDQSAPSSSQGREPVVVTTKRRNTSRNEKIGSSTGKDATKLGCVEACSPHRDQLHRSVSSSQPEDSSKQSSTSKVSSDEQGLSAIPTDATDDADPGGGYDTKGSEVGDLSTGTTGLPFLKYTTPTETHGPILLSENLPKDEDNLDPIHDDCNTDSEPEEISADAGCKAHRNTIGYADVPVGVSRLHLVKLPSLQMCPIYWSPVHDISTVTRATWFYKDTMYPVEPGVANQLEMGYRELRPWSRTWIDELNSALEVGAAGEEKVSHRLWPNFDERKDATQNPPPDIPCAGPHCAARCFHGEAAAEGNTDSDELQVASGPPTIVKTYPHAHVIYKDAHNAFILRPNLQPSAYYGRRPLQKIRRGITVGIPVVRGFDWKAWEKLHPSNSKKSRLAVEAEQVAPVAGVTAASKRPSCAACNSQEERTKVTDLILVIHGIGQKLSERVESFHFTHAINTFRRSVNIELCNEGVQRVMRDDLGGVMVLPVNWRSNLSFEDGGPIKDGDQEQSASNFSLKNITPDTIPAVRNLISDVMLDIPFYMSHHKPKMIQAVISEANRVYRLWCKNNPEFHREGRVHIIAHSLGSAMAVEVLSKQPTFVAETDPHQCEINTNHFDFNTTNLFFCGSPAGFFLLLDKGNLIPRRGKNKPDASKDDDNDPFITGEAGTFGCLAVDNIYNVMHYNDPIAYRLNATIDPQYATSLKNAQVPSATTGFFETIGNVMKHITPGLSAPTDLAVGQVAKPAAITRLPSQLEMAIHDFTREEIAEKKFSLLNDNCQVDWFLSTGGGPLEIQYINMLSAHSSYWGSPDFIRMVVIECGRKPGKGNTLPNMRAIKVGHKQ